MSGGAIDLRTMESGYMELEEAETSQPVEALEACEVCKETKQVPYKCPTCYLKYCSVKCWTSHKSDGTDECRLRKEDPNNLRSGYGRKPASSLEIKLGDYRFPSEYTVAPEKLQKMAKGKSLVRLKRLVSKPHVQDMIRKLDACEDPKIQIPICLQNSDFAKFTKFMLHCITSEDVPERDGSSSEDEV